jgi:hypothetical protein
MSKYEPLSARLAAHPGPEWRTSFAELEKALGFALPKAARSGRTWWKAGVWTDAGWTVDVDTAAGKVTFRKAVQPLAATAPGPPATVDEPPILKRLEGGAGWGVAVVLGGVAIVAGIGALAFRGLSRRK